jgi:hypothetical protein
MMRLSGMVILLAAAVALGGAVWDKAPEKWNLGDVFRILQDSPWSPAETNVDAKGGSRDVNRQTGMVTVSPIDSQEANPAPAMQLSRGKSQPAVPVLWWSSKTIRLAELRKRQLESGAGALSKEPLKVEDLADFVLVIEGSEAFRILKDSKEDLRDTVFLEIPDGGSIDLESAKFVEGTDEEEARVEFHFARQVEGQATLDPDTERVIFHCKATAKMARPTENNVLAFRTEFRPKLMKVRGVADL